MRHALERGRAGVPRRGAGVPGRRADARRCARVARRMTSVYAAPRRSAWPGRRSCTPGAGPRRPGRWNTAAAAGARPSATSSPASWPPPTRPPLSPMGIGMCGPVLIGHGTPEQKAHYLPRMLSGEDFWCQGYSEPGSGSDLASLQMSAVDDGDDFVCNGHKLWTTHANVANWIFCLVRTSQEAIRQQGITFLLIDMATPGVEVRPIIIAVAASTSRTTSSSPTCACPRPMSWAGSARAGRVAKYLMEFERGGGVSDAGPEGAAGPHPGHGGRAGGAADWRRGRALRLHGRLSARAIEIDALEAVELQILSQPVSQGDAPGAEVLDDEDRRHRAQPAPDRARPGGRRRLRRAPTSRTRPRRAARCPASRRRPTRARRPRPQPGRWRPSTSTTAPARSTPGPTRSSATSWPRRCSGSERAQTKRERRRRRSLDLVASSV